MVRWTAAVDDDENHKLLLGYGSTSHVHRDRRVGRRFRRKQGKAGWSVGWSSSSLGFVGTAVSAYSAFAPTLCGAM